MHEGHRDRLRERFINDKFNNFADHEVLEMLLFYALPRRDTNGIAHNLLNHFGSLSGVLNAEPFELEEVDGIGKTASVFISMMPYLFEKYRVDANKEKLVLDSISKVNRYLQDRLAYLTEEEFHVLCLDSSLHLIKDVLISKGSVDKANVDLKIMNKYITRYKATGIVLAHNHPSGSVIPSYSDDVATKVIIHAFSIFDIRILDHIIVSKKDCFSYCKEGLMEGFVKEIKASAEEVCFNQDNMGFKYD